MERHEIGTRDEWMAARARLPLLDQTPGGRVDELRATRHDEYA